MSTLHDRLADLAGDAPAGGPAPDLWDVGRRYHRRRRAGTVAALTVVLLAVSSVLGLGWVRSDPGIEPAAPGTAPALPERFWEPSPWLPGTDGEPTGPLAALVPAQRQGWWSSTEGVVGVSATTGEYRFLDLPEDSGRDHALSPDGTKVAYWATGQTRETPQTNGGQEKTVAAVAVWHAGTGEVTRHEVGTDHGLAPSDLLWGDSERLVLSWGQEMVGDDAPPSEQGGSSFRVGLRLWDLADEAGPVALDVGEGVQASNGRGQVLLTSSRRPVLDLESGERSRVEITRSMGIGVSALSPDGSAVAYPRGNSNPNRLFLAEGGKAPRLLLDERVWAAIGWADDDTVAFVSRDVDLDPIPAAIESLDIRTGARQVLIDTGSFQPRPGNLASDLLAVDPVAYDEPATPWDPRVASGLAVLVSAIALLALWGWRRRVRP